MTHPPTVLFVCVHNAGRSQMAAGYLTALAAGAVRVLSAGSEPADRINPVAVAAMAEEGIDIAHNAPELLTPESVHEADVVITMGCGDSCPVFPGIRYEDWDLSDPAGQSIDAVRPIRDEIRSRVEALVAGLLPEGRPTPPATRAGLPVAIIGAGPVGLAAAAHLLERGLDPVVYERGEDAGAAVSEWGHVSLFSPWSYNIDAASRRLLDAAGWTSPHGDGIPTGRELVTEYLAPLAATAELAPRIHYGTRVRAVSRLGADKTRTIGRDRMPYLLRVEDGDGVRDVYASAVIDASGTWGNTNPLGASGLPASGETEAAGWLSGPLPDVLGRDRDRFASRHTLVVGMGHSAANTLLALVALAESEPATRITWAIRGPSPQRLYGGGLADGLPARGDLGLRLRAAVQSGAITLLTRFSISQLAPTGTGQLRVVSDSGRFTRSLSVDVVAAATGFRPALEPLRELRLSLDGALEAPTQLAPLIDPNHHSCGTVTPHGARILAHPDEGFFIVGMKSYGRAPTFLMATGYEQVRSVSAALAGDEAAAERVELVLPETGVCSATPDSDSGTDTTTGAGVPADSRPAVGFLTGQEHGFSAEPGASQCCTTEAASIDGHEKDG